MSYSLNAIMQDEMEKGKEKTAPTEYFMTCVMESNVSSRFSFLHSLALSPIFGSSVASAQNVMTAPLASSATVAALVVVVVVMV